MGDEGEEEEEKGGNIALVSKCVFHCRPHCLRICAQSVKDKERKI